MKSQVFIGSSSESLGIAYAIQENLEHDADTTVWTQGIFELSKTTLESLICQLEKVDSAIFVFSPDDIIRMRGKKYQIARDNVVFELGLFIAKLGKERCFAVMPRDVVNFHLPTDLVGMTPADYNAERLDGNLTAALGSACHKIRKALKGSWLIKKENEIGILKNGFFSDFTALFPHLIENSKRITTYFIHSRRWRENHDQSIHNFLSGDGVKLDIFLPNIENQALLDMLKHHFADGDHLENFIRDAYRYFTDLKTKYSKKVSIRAFNLYPTYSFYKFDNIIVMAAYPTTARKKDVPSFKISKNGKIGNFIVDDVTELTKNSRELSLNKLRQFIKPK